MKDKLTGIYYQPLNPGKSTKQIYDSKCNMALDICRIIRMLSCSEPRIDGKYANDVRFSKEVSVNELDRSKQFILARELYDMGYRKCFDNYKDDIEKTYIETYTTLDCVLKENKELKEEIEKLKKVIRDIQDKIIERTNATTAKKIKKEIIEAFCWWKV